MIMMIQETILHWFDDFSAVKSWKLEALIWAGSGVMIITWPMILTLMMMKSKNQIDQIKRNHHSYIFDCMKAATWGYNCPQSDPQRGSGASVLHRESCVGCFCFCFFQVREIRAAPNSSLLSWRLPRSESCQYSPWSTRWSRWWIPRCWRQALASLLHPYVCQNRRTAARESKCLRI